MNSALKRVVIIGLLSTTAGTMAWVATCRAFDWKLTAEKAPHPTVSVVVNDAPLSRETKMETSFAAVVKRAAPSVVNIFSTKMVSNTSGQDMRPFLEDPLFRKFFGDSFGGNDPRQQQPRRHKERSLGSGVIVSKDGYILTNNHVVEGADEVKVSLVKNKKEYTAKVIGRDPRTDIAVLKIEAKEVPSMTLGDSDKIEVGDVALAIGNPFGIGQTVTMGIVSALGRGGMGIEDYEDFIQTDAAINPGNSGGALVDAEGRLIGINTAILSQSGGNHGVGFAVPVNLVRNVMNHLINEGRVVRGYLGIALQDLTPELGRQFNVPEETGALISSVTEKSAAAAAGLKDGDVVTELDGKSIRDSRQLKLMVGRLAPGDKVEVKVLREGKPKTVTATLKEMPEERLARGENKSVDEKTDALDGVEVGDIVSAARGQLNLPANLKGALITNVDPNSASYEAGLRDGDVIQEINHKPVTNAEEAVELSKHIKGGQVLVRVWSRGGSRYIVVEEGKQK